MSKNRRNQDYYKTSIRIGSNSPERNRNSHHNSFGKERQKLSQSPKKNEQMHDVYTSHLLRRIPKVVNFGRNQIHTSYKSKKNKSNSILKHSRTSINNVEKDSKHEKLQSNKKRSVNFKDNDHIITNKSSDETISSNLNNDEYVCKVTSVRNVIEKFNKLNFKMDSSISSKQNYKNKIETTEKKCKESKESNEYSKINKEIDDSISTDYDESSVEYIPIKIIPEKSRETKKKDNNRKKSLRSQWYIPQKKSSKQLPYRDHLLELFKPNYDLSEIQKQVAKNLDQSDFEIEKEIKRVISTQTQTTPCSSATNIMINVYNQKSPRLIMHKNPIRINVVNEENSGVKTKAVNVENVMKESNVEIIKQSVKSCIQKFEENLRKNGFDPEKAGNSTKIITNIKNRYLMKNDCQSLLSPKAPTVPF